MTELYLVLLVATGTPAPVVTKIGVFQTMDAACEEMETEGPSAHIYVENVARNGTVTVNEGACKVIRKFTVTGK